MFLHKRRISRGSYRSNCRSTPMEMISPFKRIFNSRNLREKQLPKFLQASQLETLNPQLTELIEDPRNSLNGSWISSDSDACPSPKNANTEFMSYNTYQRLKISKHKIQQVVELQEYKKAIFEVKDKDEVVVNVRHWSLTRGQLKRLVGRSDMNSTLMDLCMFLLKKKKNERTQKFTISSVAYSEHIFDGGSHKPYDNLNSYDILIFPLWKGNWILVVAYMNSKHIEIYDPVNYNEPHQDFVTAINRFIKYNYYFRRKPDYFDFTVRNPRFTPFLPNDSGVFVIKQTERIILQHGSELNPDLTEEYKKDLLDQIVMAHLKTK